MRVSVSNLDQFRRYRSDEDYPLHVLLRQLRREEPPTLAMQAGTALHGILETAGDAELGAVVRDGFSFMFDLDAEIVLAPFREIAGTRSYMVDGAPVTLSARVDGFHGTAIEDHKFTTHFDGERYGESFQWRAYLSIFNAERFTYNAFVGKVGEEPDEAGIVPVDVVDFHRITFYRYPELEEDLLRELALYVEFAKVHLQDRQVLALA